MSAEPAPLLRYRCDGCGYGASSRRLPTHCPMCGGAGWEPQGWKPFADLSADLVAAARRVAALAGADADAPLVRETAEPSLLPGVPLS